VEEWHARHGNNVTDSITILQIITHCFQIINTDLKYTAGFPRRPFIFLHVDQ